MIEARKAASAEEFRDRTLALLLEKEAQNGLPLGILLGLLRKGPAERQEHHLWTVDGGGRTLGAAVWTPPYKVTLTEMSPEAAIALAEAVLKAHPRVPGVGGPRATAVVFAGHWKERTSSRADLEMSMGIHALTKVEPVPLSPGSLRLARDDEKEGTIAWSLALHEEGRLSDPTDHRAIVEGYLREKRLFVWDDGGMKSMAGHGRETPNGVSVNMVYTPPDQRRKGYATSLVAALSQRLLDGGKKFCCLYTDLSNPTSNAIYRRIGYQPVCDWDAYRFG